MKHLVTRVTMVAGLVAGLVAGPLATAAVAAPTATITLNGSSASFSGSNVTVSGSAVTITAPGSYQVSGTLTNGYLKVDTAVDGTVEVILSGASITNSTSSALQVANADDVTVTLAAGTSNSLTDGSTYANADEPDATLFSTADLTIGGTGSLTVRGNHLDGIACKDDLVIQSGTITVIAMDDAIRGKDSLTVNGGTISVTTTSGDGLKSNETDEGKGIVNITNGTISVSVGDDGIHGENALNISGGTINVTKSYEALEALRVTISGGTTNAVATDDAVNAAEEGIDEFAVSTKASITITAGTVIANGGTDGFDSNGTLAISGGTVSAVGSATRGGGEGALDANGALTFAGGVVAGAGQTSMAVMSTVPTNGQGWVAPRFSTTYTSGTVVHIVSGSTVLASYVPSKNFREVVVSSNRITNGQSYDVYTGGSVSGTGTGGIYTSGSITGAVRVLTGVTAGQYTGGIIGWPPSSSSASSSSRSSSSRSSSSSRPSSSSGGSSSGSSSSGNSSGSASCRVGYTVNAWNTGLTASISITNTGSAAINGWSLAFTLPSGQVITSGWNATFSPTSGAVTARNASYNGTLAAGASTSIGFQATHTGNTATPTSFTLNGAACTTA